MKKTILTTVMAILLFTGCASKITTVQQKELNTFEERGLLVEEKSVTAAAWLGLLPGGGSFYTRNYLVGTLNLLLWPYSVLWDPFSGYNGAESLNYEVTKMQVEKSEKKELLQLQRKMEDKTISEEEYLTQKRQIEDKYEI